MARTRRSEILRFNIVRYQNKEYQQAFDGMIDLIMSGAYRPDEPEFLKVFIKIAFDPNFPVKPYQLSQKPQWKKLLDGLVLYTENKSAGNNIYLDPIVRGILIWLEETRKSGIPANFQTVLTIFSRTKPSTYTINIISDNIFNYLQSLNWNTIPAEAAYDAALFGYRWDGSSSWSELSKAVKMNVQQSPHSFLQWLFNNEDKERLFDILRELTAKELLLLDDTLRSPELMEILPSLPAVLLQLIHEYNASANFRIKLNEKIKSHLITKTCILIQCLNPNQSYDIDAFQIINTVMRKYPDEINFAIIWNYLTHSQQMNEGSNGKKIAELCKHINAWCAEPDLISLVKWGSWDNVFPVDVSLLPPSILIKYQDLIIDRILAENPKKWPENPFALFNALSYLASNDPIKFDNLSTMLNDIVSNNPTSFLQWMASQKDFNLKTCQPFLKLNLLAKRALLNSIDPSPVQQKLQRSILLYMIEKLSIPLDLMNERAGHLWSLSNFTNSEIEWLGYYYRANQGPLVREIYSNLPARDVLVNALIQSILIISLSCQMAKMKNMSGGFNQVAESFAFFEKIFPLHLKFLPLNRMDAENLIHAGNQMIKAISQSKIIEAVIKDNLIKYIASLQVSYFQKLEMKEEKSKHRKIQTDEGEEYKPREQIKTSQLWEHATAMWIANRDIPNTLNICLRGIATVGEVENKTLHKPLLDLLKIISKDNRWSEEKKPLLFDNYIYFAVIAASLKKVDPSIIKSKICKKLEMNIRNDQATALHALRLLTAYLQLNSNSQIYLHLYESFKLETKLALLKAARGHKELTPLIDIFLKKKQDPPLIEGLSSPPYITPNAPPLPMPVTSAFMVRPKVPPPMITEVRPPAYNEAVNEDRVSHNTISPPAIVPGILDQELPPAYSVEKFYHEPSSQPVPSAPPLPPAYSEQNEAPTVEPIAVSTQPAPSAPPLPPAYSEQDEVPTVEPIAMSTQPAPSAPPLPIPIVEVKSKVENNPPGGPALPEINQDVSVLSSSTKSSRDAHSIFTKKDSNVENKEKKENKNKVRRRKEEPPTPMF